MTVCVGYEEYFFDNYFNPIFKKTGSIDATKSALVAGLINWFKSMIGIPACCAFSMFSRVSNLDY